MFTETKTRKAAINQNPSAVALVKVCGGYKVFFSTSEIETYENNTGRALPKTAYTDYKRPAKAAPAPTPTPTPTPEAAPATVAEQETWKVDIGYNAPVVFTAKNGKIENVKKEHGAYNERRYSKWWIAAVGMKEITSASGKKEYKQVFEFGDFVGQHGSAGFAEINMRATVYAYGRKDFRGNSTSVTYFTKEKEISKVEAFNILKEITIYNKSKQPEFIVQNQ